MRSTLIALFAGAAMAIGAAGAALAVPVNGAAISGQAASSTSVQKAYWYHHRWHHWHHYRHCYRYHCW